MEKDKYVESKISKQMNKQNKNKLTNTEIILVVARGEGVGVWGKWVKGINCVVAAVN